MAMSQGLFAIALALTITAAAAAEENTQSANYIMPDCRALIDRRPDNRADQAYCLGFVWGIAQMGRNVRFIMRHEPSLLDMAAMRDLVCLDIPSAVVAIQTVKVVVAYIEARPARMHESFNALALEALRTAWPCR